MAKKVLHLTLKKKWFDMIASGEKKEEYREIKSYWISRLVFRVNSNNEDESEFKQFNYIHFTDGYKRDRRFMNIASNGIVLAAGKPECGAEPGKKYFVIKLGERIE